MQEAWLSNLHLLVFKTNVVGLLAQEAEQDEVCSYTGNNATGSPLQSQRQSKPYISLGHGEALEQGTQRGGDIQGQAEPGFEQPNWAVGVPVHYRGVELDGH